MCAETHSDVESGAARNTSATALAERLQRGPGRRDLTQLLVARAAVVVRPGRHHQPVGGGEVARYLGRYGSERIARAVLAAAVPPYLYKSDDNPDGGLDDATIAQFEDGVRGDRIAFLEDFTTQFFSTEQGLLVSEANRQYHRQIASFASPKGTLDCIAAFGRTDFRGDLERIDVPVLILHGDADAIVPFEVSGKRAADMIGDSSVSVIQGGPHAINATHADEFNRALIDFIA